MTTTPNKELYKYLDEKFEVINARFQLVEARIDQRFGLLNDRMDGIEARFGQVARDVSKIKLAVADIQDDLAGTGYAVDADSLKVLDHEQRIVRLEKRQKVA